MRRNLVRHMQEIGDSLPRGMWIALVTPAILIAAGQMAGLAGEILVALVLTTLLAVAWRAPRAAGRASSPRLCLLLSFADCDTGDVDRALDMIEGRIRSESRNGDIVRRHGARSLVILPRHEPETLENTVQLAFRLQRIAARPVRHDGRDIALTPAIGFARSDPGARDGENLTRRAEEAARVAGFCGPGEIRGWTPAVHAELERRTATAAALRQALAKGEIRPWFQPQVSTDTGDITGVEALARWEHAERGVIPPGEFLSLAAAEGLGPRLTEAVLAGALEALARWDEEGLAIPRVSINLSRDDLMDPALAAKVADALDRHGIAPARLGVEMLETVGNAAPDSPVARNLEALGATGCFIDLDDFGTGNTSISTLRRLPIRRLKIDRSFIAGIDTDRDQQGMVSAMLTMAEQLGLDVLAEGIETPGEHAMVAQLGCAHVQGFGIGRPMPATAMRDWATTHRARLPATFLGHPGGKRPGARCQSGRSAGKTA